MITNLLIIAIGIFALGFAMVAFAFEHKLGPLSFEDFAKTRGLKVNSLEKDLNKCEIIVKFGYDPHRDNNI